jgi:isoleucyl-tRNA synthetase
MDKLYRDLTVATQTEKFESVHLAQFPISVENYVNKMLESKMQKAQTISSQFYHCVKGNDQGRNH